MPSRSDEGMGQRPAYRERMVTSDNSYLCDSSKGLKLNLVSFGEAPDAVLVLCYLFLTEDGSRLRCETKQSAPLNEEYQMGKIGIYLERILHLRRVPPNSPYPPSPHFHPYGASLHLMAYPWVGLHIEESG